MNKSSEPRVPVTPAVDHTVPLFRACLLCTAGIAFMFGLSWREDHGLRSMLEGVFLSVMLFCIGAVLLLTVRARALTAPTSVRPWMRPTAMAIVIFATAVAGAAFWRWRS
ncbi:MAG: hypothetical protein ABJB74_15385 [Gemmatimonas sp.]